MLQEPIAAALAYGYGQGTSTNERWMVFDLGGGTLDIAIVESADGELRVIDHAGDNFRGGKDLDWMLLEHIVQPQLAEKHSIPVFDKNSGFWKILKPYAETAKTELSTKEKAWVDPDENVQSLNGNPISTVVEIPKSEYEQLIIDWVDAVIDLCPVLLQRCGIQSSKIDRVLLVGGPTQTPLLRRRIVERLGIQLEMQSIDPMTVVAKGAAVFAGSKQLSQRPSSAAPAGSTNVNLHFRPVYADLDPIVAGKFAENSAAVTVEIIQFGGAWSSGKLALVNGAFKTNVLLNRGKRTTFFIRAYDKEGSSLQVSPSSFSITHGMESAPPTLPMSYILPVEEPGSRGTQIVADILIEKETPLPCDSNPKSYRTRVAVRAGSQDDALHIPLVEGEYTTLDLNRHVGSLTITGKQLKKNLPENSEITVTLRVDENGIPEISAYIHYLGEGFNQVLQDRIMPEVDTGVLSTQVTEERERALTLVGELSSDDDSEESVELRADADQALRRLDKLADDISSPETLTADDRQRIERERKNAAEELERVINALELPRAISDFEETMNWAKNVIDEYGNKEDREIFAILVAEGEEVGANGNLSQLYAKNKDMSHLAFLVLQRAPGFWLKSFQDMSANPGDFTDPHTAERLLAQGRKAAENQDLDSVKQIVYQLWSLYPDISDSAESRRFLETGLRMM